MSRSPTFAEVLRDAITARLDEVRTAMPASVSSYDPVTQTGTVQPLIQRVQTDEEGNEFVESLPPIDKVPFLFPRAGAFYLTMPVQAADIVLLVIADRSLDRWRAMGGTVDPGDLRSHDPSDAVAIPGVYPTLQAIAAADVSTTGMAMGQANGPAIHITPAGVELGGSVAAPPTMFVALAPNTEARLAALEAFALSHAHPGVLPGPSATGPAPGAPVSTGPVAATKVKGI
jgi:hypothetical protein